MDSHEFNNFLHSRGADTDCPVCGYDGDWVRVQNDHDLDIAVANLPASVRVTALVCENCGFLRLHSTDAIMATRVHHPDQGRAGTGSPATTE